MPRARNLAPPTDRILRVYAFDPSRGTRLENHLTVRIPYEPLKKGPVGRKVAVIDYDASNQCYYEAIDLDASFVLGQNGLPPSEANPQFHQQMVYAVSMDTISRFEVALGREIRWRPDTRSKTEPYHGLLRIYPHAMQEANAFYDSNLRALLFGYFKAVEQDAGANLPGQITFTCLSHDIVVHETTHAVLDGIRQHFTEPTGFDAPAFHEGFADIVALLQHFSLKESLLETIQRTGGLIHRRQLAPLVSAEETGAMIQSEIGEDNPMVDLARQFGEAMGNRKALREALGTRPEPDDLARKVEPHERGAILVAAVFDAFFSVYINRTRDLVRMANPDGRQQVVPNFLHPDLANRLAEQAAKTAYRIQNICLRALDYCPPIDITFGDYLRALVTADRDAVSEDRAGYRTALISAFRARGIQPEGVFSYSEDALSWDAYEGMRATDAVPDFGKLWRDLANYEDEPDRENEEQMYQRLWGKADTFRTELGLSLDYPVQAQSIHPLHRVRPDGSLQRQIVAELVQLRRDAPLDPNDTNAGTFEFRGGTTLLIDRKGEVRYSISKPIHGAQGEKRLQQQRDYLRSMSAAFAEGPYIAFDAKRDLTLRKIHRGY
jgi:hypothetical protein